MKVKEFKNQIIFNEGKQTTLDVYGYTRVFFKLFFNEHYLQTFDYFCREKTGGHKGFNFICNFFSF